MDSTDRRLLTALQQDGRITNQALADQIGLSPSPCLRRVRALEDSGLITGYAAILDRDKAGLPITAFLRIKLANHAPATVAAFEKAILRLDEVLECHLTSGAEDYLLQVVVDSQSGYERFMRERLHPVPGIAGIETSFALGTVKRTPALPLD